MKATILADVKKSLTPSNSLTTWATPEVLLKNSLSWLVILLKSELFIVFSRLLPAISTKYALSNLTTKSKTITTAIPIVKAIKVLYAELGITRS